MVDTRISGDFLGSTTSERVAMCRRLAAEARRQAAESVNPEVQRSYLELERHWNVLAVELGKELPRAEEHAPP